MNYLEELARLYNWGSSEFSYLEGVVDQTHFLFGFGNLPDFEFAEDYGYGVENINNYIYMVLENYSDLFFDKAIYYAELESDYDLLARVKDEYEGLEIQADYIDSGIELESGVDIVNLNSVEDYLEVLR